MSSALSPSLAHHGSRLLTRSCHRRRVSDVPGNYRPHSIQREFRQPVRLLFGDQTTLTLTPVATEPEITLCCWSWRNARRMTFTLFCFLSHFVPIGYGNCCRKQFHYAVDIRNQICARSVVQRLRMCGGHDTFRINKRTYNVNALLFYVNCAIVLTSAVSSMHRIMFLWLTRYAH